MPARSKAQQKFMGMVHAVQKGELDPKKVSKDVRDAAGDMKKKDAKDFASTKHKGLPNKTKKEQVNETLVLPMTTVLPDLLPNNFFTALSSSDKEHLHKVLLDLKRTLNSFYDRNQIKMKIK